MKRQILISLIILSFLPAFATAEDLPYKQGELIVRFADTSAQAMVRSVITGPMSSHAVKNAISNLIVPGAAVLREYDHVAPGLALVKLPAGTTVLDALLQFNLSAGVIYAEPNYKYKLCVIPNDIGFYALWGMHNIGQTGGTEDADIDAPEAWDIEHDSSNIVVAVTDTGIDYEHPDVNANMWLNPGEDMPVVGIPDDNDFNDVDDDGNFKVDDLFGWDFAGDSMADLFDADNDPMDPLGHGTHVAGIIGAEGNNNQGVTGVCWNVKLMALKIAADDSDGEILASEAILAIQYAIDKGANVINASWGGYGDSQALYDVIAQARNNGILFIAAAGNEGINNDSLPVYPASYNLDNIISVMATDHFDTMAYYSNYGAASVDIAAPGGDMRFADEEGILSCLPDDSYGYMQGTSMAAPHVAGAVALMWVVEPTLTYIEIKERLLYSADPVLPGLCVSGGRLNLEKALKAARKGRVVNVDTTEEFDTIQAAISDADTLNGHELIAKKDRTYFENIDFLGKNLTLRSGNITVPYGNISPTDTFISGLSDSGRVVTIDNGQNASTVLEGFTIIDGQNGGIFCDGTSPTITDCIITRNASSSDGGGIYCDNDSDPSISNCTISDNTAAYDGGGIYCANGSDPSIEDCNITANTSQWYGGGIYADNSSPIVTDCNISRNESDFGGGGIYCGSNSNSSIINSTIRDNTADYWGGGIYCYDSSPLINNCLIIDNSVDSWDGGGIYCDNASPTITNCTIADNSAADNGGIGGGICCYDLSEPVVRDNIFSNNEHYAIALYKDGLEYFGTPDPDVTYCLFHDNSDGDYLIYDDTTVPATIDVYTGADELNTIFDPIDNDANCIDDDPLFVQGRLGNYYLSQTAAGQLNDSNAVDAGSGDANDPNIAMHLYSTRTDTVNDVNIVDMGYHYNDPTPPAYYNLTTVVIGNGSISPDHGSFIQYSQVLLVAAPDSDYQFKSWLGTDDDSSMSLTNIVTMSSNRTVTVEFEVIMIQLITSVSGESGTILPSTHRPRYYPRGTVVDLLATPDNPSHVIIWSGTDDDYSGLPTNTVTMLEDPERVNAEFYVVQTLHVPSGYSTIQAAIDDAHDRDIIVIAEADEPYISSWGYEVDKTITITSANPDDPYCVANTVIEKQVGEEGTGRRAFTFSGVGRNTVLNGLTLRRWSGRGLDGLDGDPSLDYYDGIPGSRVVGGAILCVYASPTIKNCIITDCNIIGGDGGDGAGGDGDHPNGGNGGWPGPAYGAGLACLSGRSPTVTNCTFSDCIVVGGNGGDGGNGNDDPWGNGGRGGGYYYGYPVPSPWEWGPFDLYTKYTARGAAVFAGSNSYPTFTGCTFINNRAIGGLNGICGLSGDPPALRDEPSLRWKIDSFGGAVYIGDLPLDSRNPTGQKVRFESCTFANNLGDTNRPTFDPNDPDSYDNDDSFVSYGGAVAFEDNVDVVFNNCTFNDNVATVGGGIYGSFSDSQITDSNFVGNSAYHGGGALFIGGAAGITRSDFSGNEATEAIAQGGGICSLGANAMIADCNISGNDAGGSGGGIYISSKDIDGSDISGGNTVLVKNCLITNNLANRDGGGISANWYSEPNIINCTIANNIVTGAGFEAGYGGGLGCSYGSYINVINSIIWDNSGQYGPQLAIGTSFGYDPRPSTVDVSYSDVQGGQSYVFVDEDCTLNWGAGNIHTDPLFVSGPLGDYYLSQIAAGQPVDSDGVDAGNDSAENLGMNRYTTRTDEKPDGKTVDMGYHYPFTPEAEPCRFCELFRDGIINFKDFAVFALNWLSEDCNPANEWCQHSDVTFDTYVDFEDVEFFAECWLVEDTYPPVPNPSEWEIEPYPSWSPEHPNSIRMVARTADDAWDFWVGHVQYRFDCVYGDGNDSEWQNEPNYINSNLVIGTEYGYKVRARDTSKQIPDDGTGEPGNKTEWSVVGYAMAGAMADEERNYYAVICGIADYQGVENDLWFTTNSARSVYQILVESGNWEERNITMLLDSSATKAAIQSAIQNMATRLDSDDVFLFYFSGHGTAGPEIEPFDELDGYDEYLATYDLAEVGSEEYINFQDLLRDDELGGWLEELPTDDYIVILDSCFSGGTIDGFSVLGLGNNVPEQGDGFAEDLLRIAQGQSPIALTACDEDEVAYESSELGHGVFTYYLLDAMYGRGDDEGNGNGWVSGEECYDYLVNRANSYMERFGVIDGQYGQHPQLYDADPANEFEYLLLEPINPGSPAAPSNLGALAVSSSQIDLSWTDNSNNEERFRIDRKTIGSMFEQIAAVGADETSYSDMWLVPATPYTYRVRAYNGAGDSAWSNEASATTFAEGEEPPPPDTTPPTPNPSQFAVGGSPRQYGPDANSYYWHTMTAELASDAENEPVEYYFELVAGGYGPTSSGWQLSNVYDYEVSVSSSQYGVYKVRTRDAVGNMTDWSDEWSTLGPFN